MLSRAVTIFALLYLSTLVASNDIVLGHATPFSKKIFSAIKKENPALWRRRDNIMISAPNHDYISAVYITDLRSDKEGEAYISAGGIGSRTVTISLKSPSILSGYKFSIEVYAESMTSYLAGNMGTIGGLSGVAAYPSTYPVGRAMYPIGGLQYPGSVHSQYPYGR